MGIKLTNNSYLMYPTVSNLNGNMHHAYEIWVKFTGYLKSEEIEFLKEVESKNIADISIDDLKKYAIIREQLKVHELLKDKYKNKNCTQEEHDLVLNFMENGLNEFISKRMSDEQKKNARAYVDDIKTKEELETYLKANEEEFDDLAVYSTYIYILASQKLNSIIEHEFQERIRYENAIRNQNLIKSLNRDYGPFR